MWLAKILKNNGKYEKKVCKSVKGCFGSTGANLL